MESVARKDPSAFEQLYNRFAPEVYAYLLRTLNDRNRASEALRDTFIQAWFDAALFDAGRGRERDWLMSMARQRAMETSPEAARSSGAEENLSPVPPPPEIRQEVLATVESDWSDTTTEPADTTLVGWRSRRMKPLWWLAAAALFFLALWGWSELRLRMVRMEIEELRASKTALDEERRRLERQNQTLAGLLEMLASPTTRTFALKGEQAAATATARVFVDVNRGRAMVFFRGLPPNNEDQAYQLWISRTGASEPASAGTFDTDENGDGQLTIEAMPAITVVRTLMVTLEPRGGSPSPTGPRFLSGTPGS